MVSIHHIQKFANFPQWSFIHEPTLQVKFGDGMTHLETYDFQYDVWVSITITHEHVLQQQTTIFLHSTASVCFGFEEQLARFSQKPTHFCNKMAGECDHVQACNKACHSFIEHHLGNGEVALDIITFGSDFNEPIYNDYASRPSSNKWRLQWDDPQHLKRPWLFQLIIPNATSKGPMRISDSSSDSSPPPITIHVMDMVHGFKQMRDKALRWMTIDTRSKKVYGQKYHQGTFYNAQHRWMKATNAQHNIFLNAGCNPQGLWSAFAALVPLRQHPGMESTSLFAFLSPPHYI